MIAFRQCDARCPFLWEGAAQPEGRWHAAGEGPAHYFADTPDDVAARLHFLALVISDLAGAYNEIGVRRWFHRERSLLDGKTPGTLLSGDWNPEDEGPQRVRDLARSLVMLSTT